ncbi:unnamed protein product [Arctogadus glacialis]
MEAAPRGCRSLLICHAGSTPMVSERCGGELDEPMTGGWEALTATVAKRCHRLASSCVSGAGAGMSAILGVLLLYGGGGG